MVTQTIFKIKFCEAENISINLLGRLTYMSNNLFLLFFFRSISSSSIIKSDYLQWTPTHGHTSVDQLAKTYIHKLCADTGCHLEDLPRNNC